MKGRGAPTESPGAFVRGGRQSFEIVVALTTWPVAEITSALPNLVGIGAWRSSGKPSPHSILAEATDQSAHCDDGILPLFCPTGQTISKNQQTSRWTIKPLMSLSLATVHGVVFDVFVARPAGADPSRL
jgi:hypothetical protein